MEKWKGMSLHGGPSVSWVFFLLHLWCISLIVCLVMFISLFRILVAVAVISSKMGLLSWVDWKHTVVYLIQVVG